MNERINELRKYLGLTLERFGNRVGVTKVAISNIEKGNRNVTEQMFKSICREFDVNEQWLRTGEGEMFNQLSRDEEITMWASKITKSNYDIPFVKRFVSMLSKLSAEDWEVLEKMALILNDQKEE